MFILYIHCPDKMIERGGRGRKGLSQYMYCHTNGRKRQPQEHTPLLLVNITQCGLKMLGECPEA